MTTPSVTMQWRTRGAVAQPDLDRLVALIVEKIGALAREVHFYMEDGVPHVSAITSAAVATPAHVLRVGYALEAAAAEVGGPMILFGQLAADGVEFVVNYGTQTESPGEDFVYAYGVDFDKVKAAWPSLEKMS